MPAPRRLLSALALALLLGAPPAATAQGFLYAVNETGNLTVNATTLEKLPSKLNPGNATTIGESWWDIHVEGPDRWALRLDGRVQKNGELLHDFSIDDLTALWLSLAVNGDELWALRTDGGLGRDGVVVQVLPVEPPDPETQGEFFFQQIVALDGDIYALRSDGSVYRNLGLDPVLRFVGGPGVVTGSLEDPPGEGLATDTVWRTMAVSPVDGALWALRNDGKLARGVPEAPGEGGEPVAEIITSLPFDEDIDTSSVAAAVAEIYVRLVMSADGTWSALNGKGELYREVHSFVEPLVDWNGSPVGGGNDQVFVDILPTSKGVYGLRFDGRLFEQGSEDPLVKLPKSRYRALALSAEAPDLTNFKNSRPKVSKTSQVALTGSTVTVPVLANDADLAESELTFEVDPLKNPEGAVWDDELRRFTWEAPDAPGKASFLVSVSDGVAKSAKSKNKVKLIEPDTDPLKNKKPLVMKVKGARALVGFPFSLTVQAVDPDGDELTMSIDTSKPPFTLGATFDAETGVFSWEPQLADIGGYKVVVFVSDGTVTVKRSIKLRVDSSLLGF